MQRNKGLYLLTEGSCSSSSDLDEIVIERYNRMIDKLFLMNFSRKTLLSSYMSISLSEKEGKTEILEKYCL